ncbi:flagellar motility protein MotE (MotC chaperone) [Sinobaca qinghaiensis]|uniref:Flagellar motility protein MotE (MotC chaperone) n=1 Tax=Sinobaca qinghaiensis TaxID=342944 RepID=A0A419V5Y6_9BACL|nr:hypothetical protein [Sinobaca qinghaiensis]RKD75369.1 flagellar motility protein MotE (MotC chaperone) [Sinobaca qinghaiensis]
MAKTKKPSIDEKEKEKKGGMVQWFVLIVLVPVTFAIIIGVVILSMMGVPLAEMSKNAAAGIPGISALVEDEPEQEAGASPENEETIALLEEEIQAMEQELVEKDEELLSMQEEVDAAGQEADAEEEEIEPNPELAELASMYEEMSAKNAAAILNELDDAEAIRHMQEMNTENRSAILEKMEVEKAAVIMGAFAEPAAETG